MQKSNNIKLNKNGLIDIYRLFIAIIIMIYHSDSFNFKEIPFKNGFIFVEAFFALSSYFAICHFQKKENQNNIIIEVIKYTIKKYRSIFPYVFIVYSISFAVIHIFKKDTTFITIIKDILGLLLIIKTENSNVLWYLVTMLPTLPIIIILNQKLSAKMHVLLSSVCVFAYYFITGMYGAVNGPIKYFRAIAGLSIGILVYYLKLFIDNHINGKEKFFTTIMVLCLACPIVLTAFNFTTTGIPYFYNLIPYDLSIIMFIVGFALCFSSKTKKLPANKFTNMCSKFSLLIYLTNYNIAEIINYLCKYITLNTITQYILYFSLTFICSLLLMYVGQIFDKLLKKIEIKIKSPICDL